MRVHREATLPTTDMKVHKEATLIIVGSAS